MHALRIVNEFHSVCKLPQERFQLLFGVIHKGYPVLGAIFDLSTYLPTYALQARIQKKLDEKLPKEQIVGMKLGPKVSRNQGLSKS